MSTQTAPGTNAQSWFGRLRAGLKNSANRLSDGIGSILADRKLDASALSEIEDLLITADLGPTTALRLTNQLGSRSFERDISAAAVRAAMAEDIAEILAPVAMPIADAGRNLRPRVILVVGVNGTGKTTTIGKLAHQFSQSGKKVMLAAGDTFRAAAIEQLQLWGERTNATVLAGEAGSDPAALAFDAHDRARSEEFDILLIDTAGRLHNKADLMAELEKIVRVLRKSDADVPHDCLLVLDATTGQNAYAQVETFKQLVNVTGLVVTKLDGSARGGVIVGLADRFGLPIHAIGVGEGADDLQPFDPDQFARSLLGIDA